MLLTVSRIWRFFRRNIRRFALALLLLVIGAGLGLRWYVLREWRSAQTAMAEDRPTEARDRLKHVIQLWPWDRDLHLLMARSYRLTGDIQSSERHLNRCLELAGPSEAVQLEFLLLRVQAGDIDELSGTLIQTAQDGHPDAPLILQTLSRAYILHLRYKPAFACLSLWIELYPDSARPYHWRGVVRERLNSPKEAKEDYEKALERDPDLVPVRLRIAEMLLEDKQAPEAMPHLLRLIKQVPDDPQVQSRLGICRFLEGEMAEARRLMELAVTRIPFEPVLLITLAELNLQEGRAAEAEKYLRTVLEADSSDTEALHKLATVLQVQGRTQESAQVFEEYNRKRVIVDQTNDLLIKVAKSRTPAVDDCAELGKLLLEIGRTKLGLYWAEQAIERDPLNQVANRALADYYEASGDTALAVRYRSNLREVKTPGKPVESPKRNDKSSK